MKTILILLSLFTCVVLNAQNEVSKDSLSNNWMMWSVKSPQRGNATRIEMKKEPKADFIINADGTYNIKFDNIGKGTWRYENGLIIFWCEKTDTKRVEIQLVAKVVSLKNETLTLKLITQTVHYDWTLELVPFN